jgi:hypothetical protein
MERPVSPYRDPAEPPRDLLAECVEIVAKKKTVSVAFHKSWYPDSDYEPDPYMLLDTDCVSNPALGLVARLVEVVVDLRAEVAKLKSELDASREGHDPGAR